MAAYNRIRQNLEHTLRKAQNAAFGGLHKLHKYRYIDEAFK